MKLCAGGLVEVLFIHATKAILEVLSRVQVVIISCLVVYLSQVQNHLGKKGWLDKAYVYWFDEPAKKDYIFVRSGMEDIHRFAPKLTRLITENDHGPAIMNELKLAPRFWGRLTKRKS